MKRPSRNQIKQLSMKTYAIFPVKNIMLCVDGKAKEFTPEDQVGVVSTDGVSLMDLLGAIQFHHCKAVEIDEDQLLLDLPVDEDEGLDDEDQPLEAMPENEAPTLDDQPGDELDDLDEATEPPADAIPITIPADRESTIHQFIADGLDEKVATSLVEQGMTPEDIRQLIAEGFDLTELEDIGKSRAAVLRSLYGPVPPAE
jgi:hypothetical protein